MCVCSGVPPLLFGNGFSRGFTFATSSTLPFECNGYQWAFGFGSPGASYSDWYACERCAACFHDGCKPYRGRCVPGVGWWQCSQWNVATLRTAWFLHSLATRRWQCAAWAFWSWNKQLHCRRSGSLMRACLDPWLTTSSRLWLHWVVFWFWKLEQVPCGCRPFRSSWDRAWQARVWFRRFVGRWDFSPVGSFGQWRQSSRNGTLGLLAGVTGRFGVCICGTKSSLQVFALMIPQLWNKPCWPWGQHSYWLWQ